MTSRMDVSADSEESTGFEPCLVKVRSADVISVPEKSEVNSNAVTSLLQQDPFERENATFSKDDHSFSSNEKGVSEADVLNQERVKLAPFDCGSGLNESTGQFNDVDIPSKKDSGSERDKLTTCTNEICGEGSDEISASNKFLHLNVVTKNKLETVSKNEIDTEHQNSVNIQNFESETEGNNMVKIDVGGRSDEIIDKSSDSEVSSTINCDDSNKNTGNDLSIAMDQNEMAKKSDKMTGNTESPTCNSTSEPVNADTTTSENLCSEIKATDHIENEDNINASNSVGDQVVSSEDNSENLKTHFQNDPSIDVCDKNTVCNNLETDLVSESPSQSKDSIKYEERQVFETSKSEQMDCKVQTRHDQSQREYVEEEKSEKSFSKDNTSDTKREDSKEQEDKCFQQNKDTKTEHTKTESLDKQESELEYSEESNLEKQVQKNDSLFQEDSKLKNSLKENSADPLVTLLPSDSIANVDDSKIKLQKEISTCEEKRSNFRKRIFSSGDKSENSGTKNSLVKDPDDVNSASDVYCFDGSDESFTSENTANPRWSLGQKNIRAENLESTASSAENNSVSIPKQEIDNSMSDTKNVSKCNVEKEENIGNKSDVLCVQESKNGKTLITTLTNTEMNSEKLGQSMVTNTDNESDQKACGSLCSKIGDAVSKDLKATVEPRQNSEEGDTKSVGKCVRNCNTEQEIKVRKKRGRKPKAVKDSNSLALSNQSITSEGADLDEDYKQVAKNVQTSDLNVLSVDIVNSQLEAKIESISPTRSGRKSYKKLNKEFVYDYDGCGSDVRLSPSKKKLGSHSPRSNLSVSENSDVDFEVLKVKNMTPTKSEDSEHATYSGNKNALSPVDKMPHSSKQKGRFILYKCTFCKYESGLRTNFKEHVCMHLSYKPINCNNCDFKTCHKNNIFYHCQNMHGDRYAFKMVTDTENEQFIADHIKDCRKFVFRKSSPHAKNLKKRVSSTKTKAAGCKPARYFNSVSGKTVKCPNCTFYSHSDWAVKRHMSWRHSMCTYQCPQCEFYSLLKREVLSHFSNKHGQSVCTPVKKLKIISEDDLGLKTLDENLSPKNLDTSLGPYWNQTDSARKRLFKSGRMKMEKMKKKSKSREKFKQWSQKPKTMEKCPLCSFESVTTVGVRRHMFFNHKLCSWLCTGCSATFSSNDMAVCHLETYHSGTQAKVTRTLPRASSSVTKIGEKDILSSLDREVKIARKMKKRSNLYTWHTKKKRILNKDFVPSSLVQNDAEMSSVNSEIKTECNSVSDENMNDCLENKTVANSCVQNIKKFDSFQNDSCKSDMSTSFDTAPSGGDMSDQNVRKPGRPKMNKNGVDSKNIKNIMHKKRGKKRKAVEYASDGNVEFSGNVVKKPRKSINNKKLNMSHDNSFDSFTDFTADSYNKMDDNSLENSQSAYTPVTGKKRGPKKINTLSPCIGQSVGTIQLVGENGSKSVSSGHPLEENTVLSSLYGVSDGMSSGSVTKTPKSKTITTVADVHQSYFNSDGEFAENALKMKNFNDLTSHMGFNSDKKDKMAGYGSSNQIDGLSDDRICQLSDLVRKHRQKQKRLKNIKTSTLDSGGDVCGQAENEKFGDDSITDNQVKIKKKPGRKKKIDKTRVEVDENEIWSKWNNSSYVLHPKKIEKVHVAYSCPYCNYAAPLRHQLRLHCYGRHTDRPACLIEFKTKRKPGRPPGRPKNVKLSPQKINQSKNSSPCKEANQNLNDEVIQQDEMCASLHLKKAKFSKKRFNNPLKPMVKRLNGCRVRVYDTFHSCVDIDDVDRYLDKFGVRTLNMDMLTPKQFSKFMSKFGGNLQGVDL